MELLTGLPEEIGLECLTRLPYSAHRVASQVCRRWKSVFESRDFYNHRKESGFTHKLACLVQSLPVPVQVQVQPNPKPIPQQLSYGITVFDPESLTWARLNPIPKYPHGVPLFCELCSVEGKLVVIGGLNPVSWEPIQEMWVYDFTTQLWRRGRDMPEKRSFFASGGVDGRVFVAGGHDENKNALKSAWVYSLREDEWTELTQLSEERDECEGVVVKGTEFGVVSGYGTEGQGRFCGSGEFYDAEENRWRRVDSVWGEGKCPKGVVGVDSSGGLKCFNEVEMELRVGVRGVELGELSLVSGSVYQGGKTEFYLEKKVGESRKLEKVEVEDEFSGFVQSGCCVEI